MQRDKNTTADAPATRTVNNESTQEAESQYDNGSEQSVNIEEDYYDDSLFLTQDSIGLNDLLFKDNADKRHSSTYTSLKSNKVARTASISYLKNNMMEPANEKEKQEILEKAHIFGHFGGEAIVKAIHKNRIHWPNLMQQALDLVKKCPQCQRFNIVKAGYNPHKPIHAKMPGNHWAIDLAGPLPMTEKSNTYLLVMIDICSRFVVLRPIKIKQQNLLSKL
ncbi:hypothetical protein G6F56_011836 [Rhizopus delemar]|nr:hypothetical protein G6F56_011836 [Rhizopus delemar]